MHGFRTNLAALGVFVGIVVSVPAIAADLTAAVAWLADGTLDSARSVDVSLQTIDLRGATLEIERGRLFPAASLEGHSHEIVFVGQARFRHLPPDPVEAYQLDLMSGYSQLDILVTSAVLVLGDPDRAASLLAGAPSPAPADGLAEARVTLQAWRAAPRAALAVDLALLRAALGDGPLHEYAALWCRTADIGNFYWSIDPTQVEQITLGRAVAEDFGKSPEEEDDEEEDVDDEPDPGPQPGAVWVSASLRGANGKPIPPRGASEPSRYTVEASLIEPLPTPKERPWVGTPLPERTAPEKREKVRQTKLRGTVTIDLELEAGQRVVPLTLGSLLEASWAKDTASRPVLLHRRGWQLLAVLEQAAIAPGPLSLTIGFEGDPFKLFIKDVPVLRYTQHWHPHAGLSDRATYDVTLRWPESLTLLASGGRIAGGKTDGVQWERRQTVLPASFFTFEIGHFDVLTEQVGHIALTVGFNRVPGPVAEPIRRETVDVLKASLLFYEAKFGPLPYDQMSVVTSPRPFSQASNSFLTLAHSLMDEHRDDFQSLMGAYHGEQTTLQAERIETIAHEMAHQWWGNRVGWLGYRDQWLSEAIADFSARRFMAVVTTRVALEQEKHARIWRSELLRRVESGLTVADLGPVVLGSRLGLNHSGEAYQSILYTKGAIVFAMLARLLGEEPLLAMLRALAEKVDYGVLDTPTFLAALSHMSGRDLRSFADQFVYGAGVPEIAYDWQATPNGENAWTIKGRAIRASGAPWRVRASVNEAGRWTMVRERLETSSESWPDLIVPFQVAMAGAEATGERTARGLGGTLLLSGTVTSFEIPLKAKPADFWLDQRGEVLAQFTCESRSSKRNLRLRGERLLEAGSWDEAALALADALAAPVFEAGSAPAGFTDEDLAHEARYQDAMIRLRLARVHIEREEAEAAERELGLVQQMFPKKKDFEQLQRVVLESRIDLLRGHYQSIRTRLLRYLLFRPETDAEALRRLKRGWREEHSEIALLLALACVETGWETQARQALDWADEAGAATDTLRRRLPD